MTWLIIALVFLIAIGPVLWLRPSAKDKRLSELRAAARAAGLQVDIKFIPKLNAAAHERVSAGGKVRETKNQYARYSWTLAKPLRCIDGWRSIHHPAAASASTVRPVIALDGDWVFDPELTYPPAQGWPQSWQIVESLVNGLQSELGDAHQIFAIELAARQIGLYWGEKQGATPALVELIANKLREIEGQLLALDGVLQGSDSEEMP